MSVPEADYLVRALTLIEHAIRRRWAEGVITKDADGVFTSFLGANDVERLMRSAPASETVEDHPYDFDSALGALMFGLGLGPSEVDLIAVLLACETDPRGGAARDVPGRQSGAERADVRARPRHRLPGAVRESCGCRGRAVPRPRTDEAAAQAAVHPRRRRGRVGLGVDLPVTTHLHPFLSLCLLRTDRGNEIRGVMIGTRFVLVIALVGCSRGTPLAPLAGTATTQSSSWPTARDVPELARAFYETLGVIHATSDAPDAADTPLLRSLQRCQIEPARALEHPGFARLFPDLRFFESACEDGSYAVLSIDQRRTVRLVALEPHERLPATAWDDRTEGPVVIASPDDVRLFAAAYGALKFRERVSVADVELRERSGTGSYAGTHYYEALAPSFTVTIASQDKRNYSVASQQRR